MLLQPPYSGELCTVFRRHCYIYSYYENKSTNIILNNWMV